MRNAILADFLRVQKKKSFFILMIIQGLMIVIAAIATKFIKELPGSEDTFTSLVSAATEMRSLLIGIPIFLAIYMDDFRSHAMQITIGFGMSRKKLVIARFVEALMVLIEALLFIVIVETVMSMVVGAGFDPLKDLYIDAFKGSITIVCYIAMCLILVYGTQSVTLALVIYILLNAGFVSGLLVGLSAFVPFLRDNNIHLNWILPGQLIADLAENPEYNYHALIWILVVAIFIIVPIIASIKLFEKKELEF